MDSPTLDVSQFFGVELKWCCPAVAAMKPATPSTPAPREIALDQPEVEDEEDQEDDVHGARLNGFYDTNRT